MRQSHQLNTKVTLTSNALKLIAILAMVADHIAWAFIPTETVTGATLHTIGRLTAPIMFFFIAEGYYRTSNLRKYATRLAIFALISHIPYNWYTNNIEGSNTITFYPTSVIFTLLVGLIMLICWDKFPQWQYRTLTVAGAVMLTSYSDWPFFGVLIILVFAVFRNNKQHMWVAYFAVSTLLALAQLLDPTTATLYQILPWVIGPALVFLTLNAYNGNKGRGGRVMKWGFYIFYPLHLLIITSILAFI